VSAAEEDSLVSFAALRRLVVETVEMREKTPDKGREVGALLVAAELVVWLLEERVVTVVVAPVRDFVVAVEPTGAGVGSLVGETGL
jgi:hypothetical protein